MKKTIKARHNSAKRKAINYAREYYMPDYVRDWSDEDAFLALVDEYPTLSLHHVQKVYLENVKKCRLAGIIMLPHKWVVLDVYNYYGYLEVDKWDAWMNGRKLKYSPVFFSSVKKHIIDSIIQELDLDVELEFKMVFTSSDGEGKFSSIDDIGYLTQEQFEEYFSNLEKEARDYQFTDEEFDDMRSLLDEFSFDMDNYLDNVGEYESVLNTHEKGLKCVACRNVVEVGKDNCCRCEVCGNGFPRLDTVLDNIFEYCKKHRTNFFTTNDISDYIDHTVDKEVIRSIISRFFMTKQDYLKEIGADKEIVVE